jgi:protein-disulfide isomerase/uncharacterized membrane protein
MKTAYASLRAITQALGLGASLVLLVDYVSSTGSLCTVGGGCDEVKSSAFASIAGIPTPLFGVAFFTLMIVLSLTARPRAQWIRRISAIGAMLATALLAVQGLVIGSFCQYCVVADVAAILLFLFLRAEGKKPYPILALRIGNFALAGIAALAFYFVVAGNSAGTTSKLSSALESKQGLATIVEFIDFQCPGCRALHKQFGRILAPHRDEVTFVRKHLPLAKHGHAEDAAKAYFCADQAGKAEEMADRLFTASDLSPEACEEIATQIGIDGDDYRSCLRQDAGNEQIAAHRAEATELGIRVLPTFFIGDTRFDGSTDDQTLVASIERAVAAAQQQTSLAR